MQQYIKKILESGTTALIKSNDEMEDIMKIVKSLEDSGLLLKGVSGTIQKGAKEQKRRFFSLLFGTLGASLLRNMLAGKWAIATSQGRVINRAAYGSKDLWSKGDGIIRAGYESKKIFNSASSFN